MSALPNDPEERAKRLKQITDELFGEQQMKSLKPFFEKPKEEDSPFVKTKADIVETTYQDFEDKLFDNIANTKFNRIKPVICPNCGNITCTCDIDKANEKEEEYGTY